MSKRSRRHHTPAFRAKAALVVLKGDKTLSELATQFDVHPSQITQWKAQPLTRAADVFEGGARLTDAPVDIKGLHAKIGELALEIDFLEGALSKVGLLSAKRCRLHPQATGHPPGRVPQREQWIDELPADTRQRGRSQPVAKNRRTTLEHTRSPAPACNATCCART